MGGFSRCVSKMPWIASSSSLRSSSARARDAVYRLPLDGVQRAADAPVQTLADQPRLLQEDSADDLILALADASSTPLTTSAVDGHVFDVQAMHDMMGAPALMMDVPEDEAEVGVGHRRHALGLLDAASLLELHVARAYAVSRHVVLTAPLVLASV